MDMPPPPTPKTAQHPTQSREFLEVTARMRILEERYNELNQKTELIEQNMLTKDKKLANEVKALKEDMGKLGTKIVAVEDKIITIINELKLLPRKEDVDVLKKYIDYWKPINFVTRDQLDKEIEKLKLIGKEKKLEDKTKNWKEKKVDYIK